MTIGNIRIEGGHITAIGRDQGAGIGCGQKYGASGNASCGDITITGGEVTALGGSHGAGIGSGYDGDCGNISITGGEITANGGFQGAGIGSGWKSECGNISITGGTGTATGGDSAPNDIGEGVGGSCGTVSVADGTISIRYACTLRLVYTYEGYVGVPIYNVSASQIRVSVGGKTYYAEGSSFTNEQPITVNLHAGSGLTLTVTSPDTSYQMEQEQYSGQTITTYTHDFVGTLSNVTIDGEKDLGDVILVRQ